MENPVHDLRRTLERERQGTTSPHPDAGVRRPQGPQLLPVVLTLGAVAAFVMMLRTRRGDSDDTDPLFQRF